MTQTKTPRDQEEPQGTDNSELSSGAGEEEQVFAAGEHADKDVDADNEDAARRRREAEARDQHHQKLDEEKERAGYETDESGADSEDDLSLEKSAWERFTEKWIDGISDKGNYLSASPGKNGQLSTKQIDKMIYSLVFEKGESTLYFYRNNKPDEQTIMQAQLRLQKLAGYHAYQQEKLMESGQEQKAAMHGKMAQRLQQTSVSDTHMKHLPPWRGGKGPVSSLGGVRTAMAEKSHGRAIRREEKQLAEKRSKDMKGVSKEAKGFRDKKSGQSPSEKVPKTREMMREQRERQARAHSQDPAKAAQEGGQPSARAPFNAARRAEESAAAATQGQAQGQAPEQTRPDPADNLAAPFERATTGEPVQSSGDPEPQKTTPVTPPKGPRGEPLGTKA